MSFNANSDDVGSEKSAGEDPMCDDVSARAEAIRKKYFYRRLIMQKKTGLSHRAAVGLIGPDCAYHLYRHTSGSDRPPEEAGE